MALQEIFDENLDEAFGNDLQKVSTDIIRFAQSKVPDNRKIEMWLMLGRNIPEPKPLVGNALDIINKKLTLGISPTFYEAWDNSRMLGFLKEYKSIDSAQKWLWLGVAMGIITDAEKEKLY